MSDSSELMARIDNMLEELAAIEHDRWSHWQRFMHSKGALQNDGSLLIAPDLVQRWERQISTPYQDLSEEEKESDRNEVRKYLEVIRKGVSLKKM